ncbi:nucleotidyltransferase family protein [Serratia rhizosphaerae]|uniref:nucleotidyltransferase family protein n=1 Tax=unclassified Serratia (in: enterobacteria) TaxID=2647522 RepID=UPI000CF6453F|nr:MULTISPECIES: nucleotidyltransferase family protein [unclassified Serratia (in: enterobacteria)]AVJ19179.1 molybdopterin-guanine dinucleotide biosynthesis protein MobA [Serratia sp. MYb239]QNK33295.1 nucleotidyltransferase family protein [Serratia sp. JUb9]QPT13616.1 nucleotidyltransferase family protein [Serratia rubidaea]CAE1149894.1 Molybdopterin-guanine dinucleotide biosynthesis protein MobA [Serratia sp. Tan611]
MTTGIVIAAAGRSERFIRAGGSGNKLNAPLGERTLFAQTLQQAQASGLPLVVVTRPDNQPVRRHCAAHHVETVLLDSRGLGESIAAGVAARPQWDGWLIHLADMPFVPAEIFRQTAAALQKYAIARPCVNGRPGHPVGFSATLRNALCALRGDDGGRSVLFDQEVHLISVDNPGIVQDIDLPSQLADSE